MNIQFSQEDLDFLKEAREKRNWHILVSWKQRFMYQRYVALPRGDMKSVKEIADYAKAELQKKQDQVIADAEEIFAT